MARPDDSPHLAGLLLATSRGDQAAFAELYQATSPRLFAVVLRIARRRDQAEELLQETYLRIWREAGGYQANRGAPMAWMVTIARNRALDRWRKEVRRPAAEAAEPAEMLDWGDLNGDTRDLRHCLSGLAPAQRDAILLAYIEGYTHDELARRLKSPLGTIKSWIRRGLLRLRECLEQ
ncbi:MAG: sigma-70 family RNA polymerase sigma factor [Pseudomonadota bacterium]